MAAPGWDVCLPHLLHARCFHYTLQLKDGVGHVEAWKGRRRRRQEAWGEDPERTPWGRTMDTQACCRWVQGNKLTAPRAHVGGVRDTVVATQAGFLPSQNLGTSMETGKQTRGCRV